MKDQLNTLSATAKTYSKRLYKSGLDKSEVWLAYFACFINDCLHIPLTTFIHWHPIRVNDIAIMEGISAMPGVSRADLAAFNRCRIFLGILFLSKLITADGHSIDRNAWLGTRQRHTPLLWPYQPDSGPQSWRTWRRLLATAFLDTHHQRVTKTLHNLILACPLGDWLPGSTWLQNSFKFFHSATTRQIYHTKNGISYKIHSRLRQSLHRSQVYSADSDVYTHDLPPDSVPVDELSASGSILAFRGTDIAHKPELPPVPPLTFTEYLASLPPWDCRLLDAVTLHDAPGLAQLQSDQPLFIVSDGGAAGNSGSYEP
jgi:hypothetical protein